MKWGLSLFLSLWLTSIQANAGVRAECLKPNKNESPIYRSDFSGSSWFMDLEQMKFKYEKLYDSGKRLLGRVYYDQALSTYVLPMREDLSNGKEKNKFSKIFVVH